MKIGQIDPGVFNIFQAGKNVGFVASYGGGSNTTQEFWCLTTASNLSLPLAMDGLSFSKGSANVPSSYDAAGLKKVADATYGAGKYKAYDVSTSWKSA